MIITGFYSYPRFSSLCLLLQYLLQSYLRGGRGIGEDTCFMLLFITAVPIIKLFAWGRGIVEDSCFESRLRGARACVQRYVSAHPTGDTTVSPKETLGKLRLLSGHTAGVFGGLRRRRRFHHEYISANLKAWGPRASRWKALVCVYYCSTYYKAVGVGGGG